MSLKQVVKYMFNTDSDKINADIRAYKTLRDECRTLKKAKDDAVVAIAVFAERPTPDMSGCIVMQQSASESIEQKWVRNECGMFDVDTACKNKGCKYFNANQKYFTALEKYKESRKRCRDFWPIKFARVKQ